jgi:hypothetical protein
MTSDKERLATWMIQNGFATGHGDTVDDLLGELTWQVKEAATNHATAIARAVGEIKILHAEIQKWKAKYKKDFTFDALEVNNLRSIVEEQDEDITTYKKLIGDLADALDRSDPIQISIQEVAALIQHARDATQHSQELAHSK